MKKFSVRVSSCSKFASNLGFPLLVSLLQNRISQATPGMPPARGLCSA